MVMESTPTPGLIMSEITDICERDFLTASHLLWCQLLKMTDWEVRQKWEDGTEKVRWPRRDITHHTRLQESFYKGLFLQWLHPWAVVPNGCQPKEQHRGCWHQDNKINQIKHNHFLCRWLTHCRWLSGMLGSSWCQRQTWREWTETGPRTVLGSLGGTYGWKQRSLFPWPAALFETPDRENKRAAQKLVCVEFGPL